MLFSSAALTRDFIEESFGSITELNPVTLVATLPPKKVKLLADLIVLAFLYVPLTSTTPPLGWYEIDLISPAFNCLTSFV